MHTLIFYLTGLSIIGLYVLLIHKTHNKTKV